MVQTNQQLIIIGVILILMGISVPLIIYFAINSGQPSTPEGTGTNMQEPETGEEITPQTGLQQLNMTEPKFGGAEGSCKLLGIWYPYSSDCYNGVCISEPYPLYEISVSGEVEGLPETEASAFLTPWGGWTFNQHFDCEKWMSLSELQECDYRNDSGIWVPEGCAEELVGGERANICVRRNAPERTKFIYTVLAAVSRFGWPDEANYKMEFTGTAHTQERYISQLPGTMYGANVTCTPIDLLSNPEQLKTLTIYVDHPPVLYNP